MKSQAIGFLLFLVALPAAGDTITTKNGETITGKVREFRKMDGETTAGIFVVEVDGHKRLITIEKIEAIVFEPSAVGRAAPVANKSVRKTSPPEARQGLLAEDHEPTADGDAKHWLTTSSNKRHNEKCRYYKTGNGRPCGPSEGTPCKICGG